MRPTTITKYKMKKKVLISLHDLTPFHLTRIQEAEKFFHSCQVDKVNYLLIPDFHMNSASINPLLKKAFYSWISREKPFSVEWILHGYSHESPKGKQSMTDGLNQRLLTDREGEFLSLSFDEITSRLRKGKSLFQEYIGHLPDTFVAPAWLFKKNLLSCLKEQNFKYTEDHRNIYFLEQEEKIFAPVITWATRTSLKRTFSLLGCPVLSRIYSGSRIIRIAVHPTDFDYPKIMRSLRKVIKASLSRRETLLYRELQPKSD